MGVIIGAAALRAQSVNDGFDPNANGPVNVVAVQSNGQVLLAGNFTTLQPNGTLTPVTRNYIARVNADGTLDTTFNPNANNQIYAMVVQSNGQILIGGNFTTLQPNGSSTPVTRNHIARLNSDGSLDTTFNPNATGTLVAEVFAIALQTNGQILIGGAFTNLQPNATGPVINQPNLARLNSNGTVDTSFTPDPLAVVTAIGIEPTGQIVIGGAFTSIAYKGQQLTRNHVARFNSDGSFDYGFDPNCNGSVDEIVVQQNGQILLGGTFTSLQPDGAATSTSRDNIARINSDGTIDASFGPNVSSTVNAIALQRDGKIVIAGAFFQVFPQGSASGTAVNHIARLNADGTVDLTFTASSNGILSSLAIQVDGKIVIGGNFTQVYNNVSVATTSRDNIARVNTDGSIDSTFDPDYTGRILAIAQQVDGKILLGGDFTSFGGVTSSNLVRMTPSGTFDPTFTPSVNGEVTSILVQTNGQILIAGNFSDVDGVGRKYIARLNLDGTLDTSFNPNPNGNILSMALQSNGQILIAGSFVSLQPNGASSPNLISEFARLNTDGTVDTTVNIGADSRVDAVAVQSNGQFIVTGEFTSVTPDGGTTSPNNGTVTTTRNFVARFNSDGTLDTTYDPNMNNSVDCIALQSNGQAIIGGDFTTATPDGATTATNVKNMARINTDGTLDTSFNPDPNNAVTSIAIEPDGHILAVGQFNTIQPNGGVGIYTRNYFARINYDGSLDQTFIPNPNGNVDSAFVLPNGNFYVGGGFTVIDNTTLTHIALFNADATLGTAFLPQATNIAGNGVNAIVIQPDNHVILGGNFSEVGGATSTNVARFDSDSAPDLTFNSNTDGTVNAIALLSTGSTPINSQDPDVAWITSTGALKASFTGDTNANISGTVGAMVVQSDGSVIVAGNFRNLSGVTSNNILRLTPSGQLDSSYNPDPNNLISAMVIQPNGQVIIGGAFTQLQPNEAANATLINYIARLNTDGTVDTTFNPDANGAVTCLALEPNGQILVGGTFSSFDPNGGTTSWIRENIGRLNSDGSVDPYFNPNPAGEVDCIFVQSNGQILLGGNFTSFQPNATGNNIIRNYVARINNDGSLDTFDPEPNGQVNAILQQANGQVVFGGNFSTVQPLLGTSVYARNNIARVNNDGSIDMSYDPNLSGEVEALALAPNGEIYVGGTFDTFTPNGAILPTTREFLGLIETNGAPDPSFDPAPNNAVEVVLLQSDGSLVIGGDFTQLQPSGSIYIGGTFANVSGVSAPNLALLNNDGSVNTTFAQTPNGSVNALVSQGNGQVLVGGAFTTLGGTAIGGAGRLNADTTLDTSFNPNTNGTVTTLAVQPNGQILLGGTFTTVGGVSRSALARVNSNGSLDTTFTPTVNGTISAVTVEANGQILITGSFTSVNGTTRSNIARLNSSGSLDTTFTTSASGPVYAVAVEADGQIVIGGAFSSVNGVSEGNVARLNSDGSVDTSFSVTTDGTVNTLALEADGKLFIGGNFGNVDGEVRFRFARLSATSGTTESFTVDPTFTIATWTLGGGAPQFSQVGLQVSTDDVNWTNLGTASLVSGTTNTWQLSNLSLPTGTFYLRTLGITPTTQGGSSGIIETVGSFYSAAAFPYLGSAVTESASDASAATSSASTTGATSATVAALTNSLAGASSSSASTVASSRLITFTSRANVSADNPIVASFTLSGSSPKTILLRADGPSLSSFGVQNPIANPTLQLFDSSGALVLSNSGWGNSSELSALFTQVGAYPYLSGSADAAASAVLAPGTYTVRVTGASGQSGSAIAEIYDADASLTVPQQIAAVSSGAAIDANNPLVGGFVISGGEPQTVLIRAIGPSLAGASNPLSAPSLALYDSQGNLLAQNTTWGNPVTVNSAYPAASAASIAAAATNSGAAPLAAGSSDSAVVVTLAPGVYAVEVTTANGQPGTAAVQVYSF